MLNQTLDLVNFPTCFRGVRRDRVSCDGYVMFGKSEIREELREKICAGCGQPIPDDEDAILTFYRGEFVQLHIGMQRVSRARRTAGRGSAGVRFRAPIGDSSGRVGTTGQVSRFPERVYSSSIGPRAMYSSNGSTASRVREDSSARARRILAFRNEQFGQSRSITSSSEHIPKSQPLLRVYLCEAPRPASAAAMRADFYGRSGYRPA